jgi:hypothetical protein
VAASAVESAEAAPREEGLSAEKKAWAGSLACPLAKPEVRAAAVSPALATSVVAMSGLGAQAGAEAAVACHRAPLEET